MQSIFLDKDTLFDLLKEGSNITIVKVGEQVEISSSGGAGFVNNTVQTTNGTQTTLATIATTSDKDGVLKIYVKARQNGAQTHRGMWVRTVAYTNTGGTVTIDDTFADADSQQGDTLDANSVVVEASGGNILVKVTGIASTTIDWKSAHQNIAETP